MSKENLPKTLLDKHLESLGLTGPIYIESENDLFLESKNPVESAVIFLPKSKALIDMTLALISRKVKKGGSIVLVGEKNAGIESAKKAFEKNIGPVDKKIIGNHSALYIGKNQKLGANKELEDFLSYSHIAYDGIEIEAANLPGVFSAGELDEGTRLLLDHIPYDKKKILDVACGNGVIGAMYKKKNPKSDVTLSDHSKLAVLASQKTFEKNIIEAKIIESDVFENIKGTFDLILCNPPFHSGIDTDYSFIEKFARGAKEHLVKDGSVYVVANSFLPYKEVLATHIGPTEIIADDKKYRVYCSKIQS